MRKLRLSSYRALIVLLALTALWLLALPLTAGAKDNSIFISIRQFDGVNPADIAEVARLSEEGFLPIISETEGFIAYYVLPGEDQMTAINLFATAEAASASNDAALEFVAEHMAPLLPNPPRIFEGAVEIGAINVMDKDWGDLFASLRLYDGFDTSSLDSFVSIVEDGFVPLMTGSEGFYAYMLANDGAGGVAAISMFESEESALASNEQARDFVAENLASYLPNDPQISSGSLSVAALDIDNFAKYALGKDMFVSIRVYNGIDPATQPEIARIVGDGFLPIMRESSGFVGYYLLAAGDMLAAISLFDSAAQAAASTEKAREFVAENLAPLLPNAPMIIEGVVDIHYVASADELMLEAGAAPLYAGLRIYDNFDMSNLTRSNGLVETILLPAQIDAGGLISYFSMNDRDDRIAGLSVYDTEENALAVNAIAAEFVAEHFAELLPDDPIRINGRLGVAALAEINMGANLASPLTEG